MDPLLVWGVSAFFIMASAGESVAESISTAEPKKTTSQPIDARKEPHTQPVPKFKPGDVSGSAPAVEPDGTTVPHRNDSSENSSASLVAVGTEAATASSSGQRLHWTSGGATAVTGAARTSHSTAFTEPVEPPEDHEQQPPTSISRNYSAASSATESASLPKSSSTATPGVVANESSSSSPDPPTRTPTAIQNLFSTSDSVTSTMSPMSKAVPRSTVLLPSSQPPSVATFSTTALPPTSLSKVLIPTTKSTTTATKNDDKPCSNQALMKRCLIVIASLAGVATVFMVSTIILCAKLSTNRYKVRRPAPATEMVSISALMPEMRYSYLRSRNPVRNGVLVMPGGGDSDEDGEDNVTLSSFLPENDRLV